MAIIQYVSDTPPTTTTFDELRELSDVINLLERWKNEKIITQAVFDSYMAKAKTKGGAILTTYLP